MFSIFLGSIFFSKSTNTNLDENGILFFITKVSMKKWMKCLKPGKLDQFFPDKFYFIQGARKM